MAAGATRKQKTDHAYKTLHRIQHQLANAGVPTAYNKANRVEAAHLVYIEDTPRRVDGGFNIKFHWSNMSNGETIGWPIIYFVHQGKTERFGLGEKAGDYEKGIAKIKEVFVVPTHKEVISCCIAAGCGARYDMAAPELRDNKTLKLFAMRYCPEHRALPPNTQRFPIGQKLEPRRIDRAEVRTHCPCAERGSDSTTKHDAKQTRLFQINFGLHFIVQPCTNHLTNYLHSNMFDEVTVDRILEAPSAE